MLKDRVHVGQMLQTALKMAALVCDMGYTLIKNVAQYIQDLLAENKVGLKHVILMSFQVREKLWLYKNQNSEIFSHFQCLASFLLKHATNTLDVDQYST